MTRWGVGGMGRLLEAGDVLCLGPGADYTGVYAHFVKIHQAIFPYQLCTSLYICYNSV